MSAQDMIVLMGIAGISAAVCGAFVASSLSDRIGCKPVMVVFCLIGVLAPVSGLLYHGSLVTTALLLFLGTAASGTFPLFMAAIPSESLPARHLGTSIELVVAVGEVVGGIGVPLIAGSAADCFGLASPRRGMGLRPKPRPAGSQSQSFPCCPGVRN